MLAWLVRMKSFTGGPYGMLLYDIKVLLGYLSAALLALPMQLSSLECTAKRAIRTMRAHLENRTYKQVMATFATFIGTEITL